MFKNIFKSVFIVCSIFVFSTVGFAQEKTQITVLRFLYDCTAEYKDVIDIKKAVGECGVITVLTNAFNATNKQNIVVNTKIVEWAAYYDNLKALIATKALPAIAIMHGSAMGDFIAYNSLEPMDDDLKAIGINSSEYSDYGKSVTKFNGKIYGLPIGIHSWMWHVNTKALIKAGLTNPDGTARIPKSAEELLTQARQYKKVTGKPYFSWSPNNELSNFISLMTLVAQQKGSLFPGDASKLDMHSPEVRKALELMKTLSDEGLMGANQEYEEAHAQFLKGETAVRPWGTWSLEGFLVESGKKDVPLSNAYLAIPFPKLYATNAVWADGHVWVMPKGGTKDEKSRKAAMAYLKYLRDHNFDWVRSGLLPDSLAPGQLEEIRKLPMRDKLMEANRYAVGLPSKLMGQRSIQSVIGGELVNMLSNKKSIEAVQRDAESRVNAMLAKPR
jgi:multiple sugar transport system substrate-binding protein